MGTSLTGKQIKNTYKSLIKVSDNTEASASAKQLSDGNGNDFGVYIDTDGVFGIGSAPSYSLDVSSRTDGVALPVGTTANRPTGFNGLIRYNSTIGKVEFYDTGWKTIYTTSGGTISGDVTVTGDLIVQGTTVTLNTETVQFEDNILMLNRASNDTQYSATNAGIELEKTSATNPSFLYTYADSTWTATDNFKIEGNLTVDTNTLYVDATNNRVGIGTVSPIGLLELHQGDSGQTSVIGGGDNLVLNDSANGGMTILTPSSSIGGIFFGDEADSDIGKIQYVHANDDMIFSTNTSQRLNIKGGGDISFRDTSNNEAFYWDASTASLSIGAGTSPTAPLQVERNSSGWATYIKNTAATSPSGLLLSGGDSSANFAMYVRNAAETSDLFAIKGNGNVGIGTNSPVTKITLEGAKNTSILTLRSTTNDASWAVGDRIGGIDFYSNDNSGAGAGVKASISYESISSTGGINHMVFRVAKDSTNNQEAIRILNSGGITFNGDTATANALDDYEEGTWTPAVEFSGASTGITYTTQSGAYTKIGRQVTAIAQISLSSKGTSTGSARITGLPFTIGAAPLASSNISRVLNLSFADIIYGYGASSTDEIILAETTNAGSFSTITDANFQNDSQINITITYFV